MSGGSDSPGIPDRPVAFYRVRSDFVAAGLYGRLGDILSVWPGHPSHAIVTREAGRGWRRLRSHGGTEHGIDAGSFLRQLGEGTVTPLAGSPDLVRVEA